MKFRNTLDFSTGMVFVIMSDGFFLCTDFDHFNNIFHCNLLTYPVILHIDVFCPVVIHVILSEMYYTLTDVVDLN